MDYLISSMDNGRNPKFICPNCNLRAAHDVKGTVIADKLDKDHNDLLTTIYKTTCYSCNKDAFILQHSIVYSNESSDNFTDHELLWKGEYRSTVVGPGIPAGTEVIVFQKVVEPDNFVDVPSPNLDLSEGTTKLYNEAAAVLDKSPRATVALLRVTFETFLRNDLKLEGKSINDMLGNLYSSGIPKQMDDALHFVRIAGNAADHTNPGEIRLDGEDGIETAKTLFEIINYVANEQITQKKKLTGLTKYFTPGQKAAIERLHDQHK